MRTLKPLKLNRKMRRWQEKAIRRFYALNKCDFLLVATPGGGKTFVALMIAYQLILEGEVERIVIVTPTEHLKRQWAEDAALLGIDIDFNWNNADGRESSDYFGVAVTFHQVSFAPDLFALNCKRKTLVIFDEVHHAGDNLEWGNNLRQAFQYAEYRLCLSGTPFRSDDNPIPFVEYIDNKSRADFTYGYGQALADGVCRPIYFPTVEGNVAWIRPNGKEMECSMLDNISRIKANERLRSALDSDGEWLPEVLREADFLLTKMRLEGHADAAGLVIALDQFHARKIAKLLKIITNETPTIAISDEEDSTKEIRKFAKKGNNTRWIVAVKMVSEGVDIPRLRVGVYGTTILSELFFRQVVGRFVRMIEGLEDQSAALYLPFDQRLVAHALSIKEEREHILQEQLQFGDSNQTFGFTQSANEGVNTELKSDNLTSIISDEFEETGEVNPEVQELNLGFGLDMGLENTQADETNVNSLPQPIGSSVINGNPPRKFIIPLSSTARMHETVFNGDKFTPAELNHAETISSQIGMRVPPAQVAALIKMVSPNFAVSIPATNQIPTVNNANSLLADRKHQLRKEINKLANRLANLLNKKADDIHRKWIVEQNGSKNNQATESELQKKYDWLKNEIIRIQQKRNEKRN